MRKQLLMLSIPLLLIISCSKDPAKPNGGSSPEINLYTIEGILTPFKSGKEASSDRFTWSIEKYDLGGRLVEESRRQGENNLNKDKSKLVTTTFIYDKDTLIGKQDGTYRYEYVYNRKDTIGIKKYDAAGLIEDQRIAYDSNGQKRTALIYNSATLHEIRTYFYGFEDLLTAIHIQSDPLIPGDQLVYTYDSKRNVLVELFLNRAENTTVMQKKFGYKYDENGRIVEYIFNSNGLIEYTKHINTYNEKGLLTRKDISTANSFQGPYEQAAVVNYTYNR
jgi:hypothetical protein